MKNSAEIRSAFLNYFRAQGHTIIPSSSLIPHNDPTLLFTNSGIVQFKDILLGTEETPYDKVATVQRCVRAGGKHNDLENVGYTTRHHTFFEMLGNFSFGAYFKREAITYAWDFLTKELDIPKSHLRITVFTEDNEAADIWLHEIGIKPEQLSRLGEQDNFWQMGDTGPCGPCTEIFYDHGEQTEKNGIAQERYVEIWNLVFTQYNRHANGDLTPLPKPAVDTGMGLERITAVMQNVQDNYDIDSFQSLLSSIKYPAGAANPITSTRVIADHIRSCAFLIADGVLPSNDGRGYVLRRIIRRAIRHGNKIGLNKPFFHKLVTPLQQLMGETYPELAQHKKRITSTLLQEEQRFAETLEQGLKHLKTTIDTMQGTTILGQDIFKLYDTYGFPVDLTADIAREQDLQLDYAGFETAMKEQRTRARSANKFNIDLSELPNTDLKTEFIGYQLDSETTNQPATVIGIYKSGQKTEILPTGDLGQIILNSSSFYAESGGQIGDTGELIALDTCFQVKDTQKKAQAHIHIGKLLKGELRIGQQLNCQIDTQRRLRIMRNHSATHLLHAALKHILGDHVTQKGSLVSDDNLRFDFSHDQAVNTEQIHQIESLVNKQILQNQQTSVQTMTLEAAQQSGAISLFNEKYAQMVRVLNIGGSFSKELCGGTHVNQAGDIGLIKIISQSSVAAGIRRIEAITGENSLHWVHENEKQLDELSKLLKTDRDSIVFHTKKNLETIHKLEKTLSHLQAKQAENASNQIIAQAEKINDINVSAQILEGVDIQTLRKTADQMQQKLGTAVLVLATTEHNKVTLISSVTKNISDTINAAELVNFVAHQVDGKGGGRADMAQAGGTNPAALNAALASIPNWVRNKLQNTA